MERSRIASLLAAAVLFVGALLVPSAGASRAASLSLDVNFFANGTIAVTLPDGSPVGVTSGSATMIPAGFYNIVFSGPGGCSALPYFHLTGPGTNIVANMNEGSALKTANTANFLPSSTYVWISDAFPTIVHTFVTSSVIEGSPPPAPTTGGSTSSGGKGVSSQDIIGSQAVTTRTLTATVSGAGTLSLTYLHKSVRTLKRGRYTVAVVDRSSAHGLIVQEHGKRMLNLSGVAFIGKHKTTVNLTAGSWLFAAGKGTTSYTVTVK